MDRAEFTLGHIGEITKHRQFLVIETAGPLLRPSNVVKVMLEW
jgi:hypothetical protein